MFWSFVMFSICLSTRFFPAKALLVSLFCLLAASSMAQKAAPESAGVKSVLSQKLVSVGADGKEVLAEVAQIKPGEKMEYAITYTNNTKDAAKGLQATLPIPLGTQYLPSTAKPVLVLASLDGKTFALPPLKRKVVKDGVTTEVEVSATEYRALRWRMGDLAAAQSVTASARVLVNPLLNAPAASPAPAAAASAAKKP
jgi:uncharacterized repeat protein (TIGR01451 family)